jgi:hypothetical protein
LKPRADFFKEVYISSDVYFRIIPGAQISPRSPKTKNPLLLSIGDDLHETTTSAGGEDRYISRMLRQMERTGSMESITQLHVDQIDKPPPIQV